MIRKRKDVITGFNRKGLEIGISSVIAAAVGKIKHDFTVDGEFVGDIFHTFDILDLDGKNLESKPLKDRLESLKTIPTKGPIQMVPTVYGLAGKMAMLEALRKLKREGIVFKKLSAAYRAGRAAAVASSTAIKHKFWETASVLVKGQHEGKSSVTIQLYDHGKLTDVGHVTIAANQKMPPPGAVIEVRYLYAYKGGSLVQATFIDVRDDIDPPECTTDQLKWKVTEESE